MSTAFFDDLDDLIAATGCTRDEMPTSPAISPQPKPPVLLCVVCGAKEANFIQTHDLDLCAKCVSSAATTISLVKRLHGQTFITAAQFMKTVSDLNISSDGGHKQVHILRKSSAHHITMVCRDKQCDFSVTAFTKQAKGCHAWTLRAAKFQTYAHSRGCQSEKLWPKMKDLVEHADVRQFVNSQGSISAMYARIRDKSFRKAIERCGFVFPTSPDSGDKGTADRIGQLLRRVANRILGYDDAGLMRNLNAILPFAETFNQSAATASKNLPCGKAFVSLKDGNVFDGIVVVYGVCCELVRRHGLPLFGLDACHFTYPIRNDLRLLVLAGYFADNTIVTLAVAIVFGETEPNYRWMLERVKSVAPNFWQFFDNPNSTLFIDRGSALAAIVNGDVLVHGKEMYWHCYVHVLRSCEANKGHGPSASDIITNLCEACNEEAERALLQHLKTRNAVLHHYVTVTMDRRRFIIRYMPAKLTLFKKCSNVVEIMNSVYQRIQAREVMPFQAIHLISAHNHGQLNHFLNRMHNQIAAGDWAFKFVMDLYAALEREAARYVVVEPAIHCPYTMHTVRATELVQCPSARSYHVCVHTDHISCSCQDQTFIRMGMPCVHMIAVAKQPFRLRTANGSTVTSTISTMPSFTEWTQSSGLFFNNFLLSTPDVQSSWGELRNGSSTFPSVMVPDMEHCLERAARMSHADQIKLPPLTTKHQPSRNTKRIRSRGEVGDSARNTVRARPSPAIDVDVAEAQERFLQERNLVGKHLMIAYKSGKTSKSTFQDSANTPTGSLPRPVTVVRAPWRDGTGRRFFKVRCALAKDNDVRKGIRIMFVERLCQFYPVARISAAMKKNQWTPPHRFPQRVRTPSTRLAPSIGGSSNSNAAVGVTKVGKKWRARVEHQGQRYNLGFYTSWEAAAAAVDKKREELQQQARGS
jgi:hypothetical protein